MNEITKNVQEQSITSALNTKKSNKFFKWDINESTKMPDFQTKNGRLVFKNSFTFLQATRFAKQKPLETMKRFQENANYQSLYHYKISKITDNYDLSDLPDGYADILNEKGEVQIGDTLVCYAADGFKYFIPNGDETMLKNIETNPSLIPLKFEYRPKRRDSFSSEKGVKQAYYTYFAPNTIDARYQKVYNINNDGGSKRKIVYEMAFYQDYWFAYSSYVSQTKLKLEWWSNGNGNWQPAGEVRIKTIKSLNASTRVYNDGQAFDWNVYSSPLITRKDGADLSQALLQGWTWGGLDYAHIDSGYASPTEYDSYVDDLLHTNFGGRYIVNAQW